MMDNPPPPSKDASPTKPEPNTSTPDDLPPPPYHPSSSTTHLTNPGFCDSAFLERHQNRVPGGGMPSSQYSIPCPTCSVVIGSSIPPSYRVGWTDWVDPSVNFRWESHTGCAVVDGEQRELLGCWICWEWEGRWEKPMFVEEWYLHVRGHFRKDGFVVCKGGKGVMQRRRNCAVVGCPKVHS